MNKGKQSIEYGILWKKDALRIDVIEKKQLESILLKSCEVLDITFKQLSISKDSLYITFLAKHPLNLGKVNGTLQKQMKKHFPEMAIAPFVGITKTGLASKKDVRIQNIMSTIDEIAYYDLDEVCEEEQGFKAYLGDRPLTILEQGEQIFLIDEEALAIPIYLNCFECTKIYQYGCCCGSPCDMSEKNKKSFKRHQKKIEEAMKETNDHEYMTLMAHGGFMKKDGSINEYQGRCAMLVEEDGIYKCMTHKYALDNSMPIYDLCPLSCLMYPLEIIELIANYKTRAILLTSAVEEAFAKDFSRWGSYDKLDVELRCLKQKDHDEQFPKENYKPVYKVNEGLLKHEFGENVYTALRQVFTQ